ncbi:MAG: transposase [Ignavibacteriales bacterium CG_4_9_14_3_um_filter_30_11]|nr:MAG: transposase [Ignavibacteriales bacterium CG_4_9_14_3_um_filter_30_11]
MSHSLTKIWLHGVFGTKDRMPLITENHEKELHNHIKEHLEKDFECSVRIINGTKDHIHILFLLNQKYSVQEIFKNVKGESSHWVNQQNHLKEKFSWQTGYGAFSVSESMVKEVEKYILTQKEHHKKITFSEEVALFIKKYDLQIKEEIKGVD